jgi:hypothetical protein
MSVFQEVIADADLPVTTAAGVPETVVGEAPFNGTMTEAGVIPEAALTAADATDANPDPLQPRAGRGGYDRHGNADYHPARGQLDSRRQEADDTVSRGRSPELRLGRRVRDRGDGALTGTVRPASKFIARGIHS